MTTPQDPIEQAAEKYSEEITRYYSDEFDRELVRGAMQTHFLAGARLRDKEVEELKASKKSIADKYWDVAELHKQAEARAERYRKALVRTKEEYWNRCYIGAGYVVKSVREFDAMIDQALQDEDSV